MSVTFLDVGTKEQHSWKGFSIRLKARNLSPSFTGSSSLPSFQYLDYGFNGDSNRTINKIDSYTGSFTYLDRSSDSGTFVGTFTFSTADMILLRNYIRSQRGGLYSISGINGVSEMFGPRRGGSYPYSTRLVEWEDRGMLNINYWKMRLTFVEEVS